MSTPKLRYTLAVSMLQGGVHAPIADETKGVRWQVKDFGAVVTEFGIWAEIGYQGRRFGIFNSKLFQFLSLPGFPGQFLAVLCSQVGGKIFGVEAAL